MDTASPLEAMLEKAIARQRDGRLDEAAELYRTVLEHWSDSAVANHNLAVLTAQRGDPEQSLPLFKAALASEPGEGQYWLSYARGLLAAGHAEEALRLLRRGEENGLAGPPVDTLTSQARAALGQESAGALYGRAIEHHRAGRVAQAAALYRQVISVCPDHGDAYGTLGAALAALGQLDDAVDVYRSAAARWPDSAERLDDLGSALTTQGAFADAIAAYRRAVAIKPDFADAHFHLGSVLSETGEVAAGFEHFMRRAELVHGSGAASRTGSRGDEPPHKVKHDREQRAFLAGASTSGGAPEAPGIFRIEDGRRLAGPAINPASATPALLEQWRSNRPQMVVIENFLTLEALERLRRYCAGSTIWRRIYDAGYIGATPEDGFACPLLAQIVEEVQSTYFEILQPHRFRYLGAFKYDSEFATGTNTHADNSALNVNFYIAPDEANLDPDHGGMKIWDVSAPDEAAMRRYNRNEADVRAFLERSGGRSTIVPHRANRAVLFRSDLFHKTDRYRFKEGYLNKRINVSLLFGKLEDAGLLPPTSHELID